MFICWTFEFTKLNIDILYRSNHNGQIIFRIAVAVNPISWCVPGISYYMDRTRRQGEFQNNFFFFSRNKMMSYENNASVRPSTSSLSSVHHVNDTMSKEMDDLALRFQWVNVMLNSNWLLFHWNLHVYNTYVTIFKCTRFFQLQEVIVEKLRN